MSVHYRLTQLASTVQEHEREWMAKANGTPDALIKELARVYSSADFLADLKCGAALAAAAAAAAGPCSTGAAALRRR